MNAHRTHRFARGWHCLGNANDYRDGKPHTLEVFGTRLVAFAESQGAIAADTPENPDADSAPIGIVGDLP